MKYRDPQWQTILFHFHFHLVSIIFTCVRISDSRKRYVSKRHHYK